MKWVPVFAIALLGGCVSTGPAPQAPSPAAFNSNAEQAARRFVSVVERMEPVVEAACRSRAPDLNCDFDIVVDTRGGQPPNAFQTLDETGRPILTFNIPLIAAVQNVDELAFVLGHEAAHHILRHLARQQANSVAGAVVFGTLAAIIGGDTATVQSAQDLGGTVGARGYSKDFELEADRLGTVLAHQAGYDPLRGALFFTRLADPGNRFFGTHPPNAARIDIVRQTATGLN